MMFWSLLDDEVQFQARGPLLTVSRATGGVSITWNGATLSRASMSIIEPDGTVRQSTDAPRHVISERESFTPFGPTRQITIRHLGNGPELRQTFWLLKNRPEIIVQGEVMGGKGYRKISPLSTTRPVLPNAPQTLYVPYDNDDYARYDSNAYDRTSHEVSARYDAASRRGLVVGSLDHDLWKSGITFQNGLRITAGETDPATRDRVPHGVVTGSTVKSPRYLIGLYSDWRAGLERFGDLNAVVQPPLPWTGPVPFGWNSWAAVKEKLNSEVAMAAIDLVDKLPTLKNFGAPYVNLDSYWDNLTSTQLNKFVEKAHRKGFKAGIYWTPFVAWGGLDGKVGNTPVREVVLKDERGEPLAKLDGGWPLDPTHPAVLAEIDRKLGLFVRQGFDFIKLDFMTHGALEGQHYEKTIETGTAAYQVGMHRIQAALDPKKVGRPIFISLSIAPLFPAGFAHSRRISCDAFADLGASEYLMNSAAYGWWTAGRLYPINDPDHTVLYRVHNESVTSEDESNTRLLASVVAGGMLLNSDDPRDPQALERVRRAFGDEGLLSLAAKGLPFRPVEGSSGDRAEALYVLRTRKTTYVAAFNFSREPRRIVINPQRLGLKDSADQVLTLRAGESRLIKLSNA